MSERRASSIFSRPAIASPAFTGGGAPSPRWFPPITVVAFLLFSFLFLGQAAAQTPVLETGNRVRLSGPLLPFQGIGRVRDQSADDLTIATRHHTAPFVVPWNSIATLAVSEPRSKGQGARRGAKWGLGIGIAVGVLVLAAPPDPQEELSNTELAVQTVGISVGIGALFGSLLPGSRWRDIDIPLARENARRVKLLTGDAAIPGTGPVPTFPARTSPGAGATPAVEMTFGLNGPQLPQAQFPGLTGSVAVNRAWRSSFGGALIAEGDVSYLRPSLMAGTRIYGRSGPLFERVVTVTYFGQILAGAVGGAQEGVLRSTGGFAMQPGVGIDVGGGAHAIRLQFDYRNVPGSVVEDSRLSPPRIADLSGPRFVIGYTARFRSR